MDADRAYVIETLAQELDLRTPTASVSPGVNRGTIAEYLEENEGLVEDALSEARTSSGELSPFIITKRLLPGLIVHARTRIRRET